MQDTGARLDDEHVRHVEATPVLTPSRGSSDCPKCDAIYAEWLELWRQQRLLISTDGNPNNPNNPYTGYISQTLTNELRDYCWQGGNGEWCPYLGCYISKGNATTVDTDRSPADARAAMCDRVPFRELAHTITAYALNGSNMSLEIFIPPDPNGNRRSPETFIVPNSWFVQTAFELNRVINSLPSDVRQAVKLAEEDVEPFPSIGEVFAVKMRDATFAYIRNTSASWPWTPPPPPPPPTPPPCPGGNLQACMGMCPKEPITEYKKCVQNCFDVCHGA